MFFFNYRKIYSRFTDMDENKFWSFMTTTFFCVILASLLFFLKNDVLVLKIFPLFVFSLLIIEIFARDSNKNISSFLYFLKSTPLSSIKITFYNYFSRLLCFEEVLLYIGTLILLTIYGISFNLIFLFIFRIALLIFLAQTLEYVIYFIKGKYVSQLVFPIILLCIVFMLNQNSNIPGFLTEFINIFIYYYDYIFIGIFCLSIFIAPFIVKILINNQQIKIPVLIISFSNISSKSIRFILSFNKVLSKIVEINMKIYIRSSDVLFKYLIIITMSITYSSISYAFQGSDPNISNFNLTLMLSIYFFNQIRVGKVLETNNKFNDRFPISSYYKRLSIDIIECLFNITFVFLALSYHVFLFKIEFSNVFHNLFIYLIFYVICLNFNIKFNLTKKEKIYLSIKYSLICLFVGVILTQFSFSKMGLFLIFVLIWTYFKNYKHQRSVNCS